MTSAQGFPAFGPQRRGKRFAESWWGQAWIRAMEDVSLDHALLAKGRAYAKRGTLGPITVSPGRIATTTAEEEVYDTVVHVEQLGDDDWARFLDAVAARAGHIAALLDGELPPDLVEDTDVRLLPSVGDLEPECDCPGFQYPCRHAAALCYQASWLLDADPFLLLLMRGRGRAELLSELRARNSAPTGPAGLGEERMAELVATAASRARGLLGWER
jgi:uncharacterized Zn finger protein